MHFPSVTLLAGSMLLFSGTSLGGSILAFAPITALSGQYALEARHIGGACPAASQTSCSDGIGCCPSGAACTYSSDLPVCDELCGAGPKCSNGGCCQAGYFCGVTNNFCTPSPTGIVKMPTFSGPVSAPLTTATATIITSAFGSKDPSSQDISSPGGTVGRPTATSTSTRSTRTGGGQDTSGSSHTPSNTAGRSRTSTSTTSTTTRTGAAGGGAVAKTTSSRHSPTPSSTGAASSLDAVTGLTAMGFGWIAGLFAIL